MADSTDTMMNFCKMNLFRTALSAELCNVVAQQDQPDQKGVQDLQRESKDSKRIALMADESNIEQEEYEVAAFQRWQNNWQGTRPKNNQYQQRNNEGNTNY
jgi:hypothetical protein